MKMQNCSETYPISSQTASDRFLALGFSALLNHGEDGCFLLDPSFTILYLNKKAAQFAKATCGIAHQVGDNLLHLLPGRYQFKFQRSFFDALQNHTVSFEAEYFLPSNEKVTMEHKCIPISNELDDVIGVCVLMKDISLQKSQAEAEEKAFQLLEQFMENSPLSSWITDADTTVHYMNSLNKNYWGIDDNYKGKSLIELFSEEYAKTFASENQTVLNTGKPLQYLQIRRKKDGKASVFKIFKFPVWYKNKLMVAGWATEVTKQAQLRKKIRNQERNNRRAIIRSIINTQEKERRQLSIELHDNINQVISSCKLMMEVARDNKPKQQEMIEKTYQSLKEVIFEVRKISDELNPPALNDIGLVEAVNEMVEQLNLSGNLSIEFDHLRYNIIESNPEVDITIYRIIQEGLNNVVKYANASNVWITLYSNDAHILVTIRDNGVGFDTEKTKRGFGLRNIHYRAEYHYGKMKLHSRPNQGCTLKVLLPIPSSGKID